MKTRNEILFRSKEFAERREGVTTQVKYHNSNVILAKAGIQRWGVGTGFPIRSGMTKKAVGNDKNGGRE